MDKSKQNAIAFIEEKAGLIADTAQEIWTYAELSLREERSAALLCRILEDEGFAVERGICGIPTAFAATFGKGRPHIGVLAEYDALSGLSQKGGATVCEPLDANGSGHGCGHNLLGAGALGAALGIRRWLEETGAPGTVTLYGCPGEEGGAAKAFMARDGLWKELDAALTWHPSDCNEVVTGSCNSTLQVQYTFRGVAAHAAGAPERGRSALDAAELMNVGVQFLREHMSDRARIHYAITDTGGRSANVVQPRAAVLYMVRSNRVSEAVELLGRVDRIAQGAAMMTDTACERKFIDGTADTVTNHVLEEVVYRNFETLGAPRYLPEELAFAEAIRATYEVTAEPGGGSAADRTYAAQVKKLCESAGHAMNDFLLPRFTGDAYSLGSTDVGDVSWLTPTVQLHVAAFPNGCPGHSWQNVSCGATSLGHRAAVRAAQVLCAAAVNLFTDPTLLAAAREEFAERTAGGYVCPIPPDAVPTVAD